MKRNPKSNPNPLFPKIAQRVTHPILGIRCWKVGAKYYRSRADYFRSLVVRDGVSVDTSIQIADG